MCDQVSICAIYGAGVADSEVRRLLRRLRLRINDPGCTFGGNLQPARVGIFPVGVKPRRQIKPCEWRRNKKQTRQLIQGDPKQTRPLRLTFHIFKAHETVVRFLNAVWFWIHLSTLHLSNLYHKVAPPDNKVNNPVFSNKIKHSHDVLFWTCLLTSISLTV